MKRVILVARVLLGLVFVFFGSNLILHFYHADMPTGDAGQYMEIMVRSKWMTFAGLTQLVGGILLLVGRCGACAGGDGAGGVSDLGLPRILPHAAWIGARGELGLLPSLGNWLKSCDDWA